MYQTPVSGSNRLYSNSSNVNRVLMTRYWDSVGSMLLIMMTSGTVADDHITQARRRQTLKLSGLVSLRAYVRPGKC